MNSEMKNLVENVIITRNQNNTTNVVKKIYENKSFSSFIFKAGQL